MAIFGSSHSIVGLDIGTSSLKLVELLDRKKRIELTTYAQANLPNLLVGPPGSEEDAIRLMANVINQMMEKAEVASETVIAALPSSVVFSTVVTLPEMPEDKMSKAVIFAARDVVPAKLDDMVIGWSRMGDNPHMASDPKIEIASETSATIQPTTEERLPVFITAAPKEIVNRYKKLMAMLNLKLQALEVETFPLARSLLETSNDSALIADLGDKVTTFHLIDSGTARVSHSIDFGGSDVTLAVAQAGPLSTEQAALTKVQFGLSEEASPEIHQAIVNSMNHIFQQAEKVITSYYQESGKKIGKTIVIGGGANMRDLIGFWSKQHQHPVTIGNPWKGLSYPDKLEGQLTTAGSQYAVAVGLARRGFTPIDS